MDDHSENDLKRAVASQTHEYTPSTAGEHRNRRLAVRYVFFAFVSLAIIIGLGVGLGVGLTRSKNNSPSIWQPTANTSWNIDLSTVPSSFSPASTTLVYDIDLFATPQTTISSLKNAGHKVICYFSAGSYENWRPDASSFPESALGNPLDGWPGERWVNTSDPTVRNIMKTRITMAQSKGCDGVDPDNIDGYENDSGLGLTTATAIDYVDFLAAEAHALGLACGLKNGGAILGQVLDKVQWVVDEQCAEYDECNLYDPMVKAGKPVFQIEYTADDPPPQAFLARTCGSNTPAGFSTLIKHMDLGTWTAKCPGGSVVPF